MPNASLLRPDSHVHGILIGPSGAGKTVAACSWPGKTFVLDFDDRIKGILGVPWLEEKRRSGQIEWEKIMAWTEKSCNGLAMVYRILESLDTRVGKGEIDNVVLDSTSSMVRFFVNESTNQGLKTSGRASSMAHFQIGEAIVSGKQDHLYAATCIANILYDNLKTFRCNVFVSSHFKDKTISAPTEAEPDRVLTVGHVLKAPGQLAEEIPTWFDETWEFKLDDSITSQPPKRYVLFQSAIAKTSILGIPHKLEITGKSLYDVVKPYYDKMSAQAQEKK